MREAQLKIGGFRTEQQHVARMGGKLLGEYFFLAFFLEGISLSPSSSSSSSSSLVQAAAAIGRGGVRSFSCAKIVTFKLY